MCEGEKQFVLLLGCEADWGREKEETKHTFPSQFLLGICVKWDCVHWRCFSVRLRWIKSSSLTRSSPTPSRQHKQRDLWTVHTSLMSCLGALMTQTHASSPTCTSGLSLYSVLSGFLILCIFYLFIYFGFSSTQRPKNTQESLVCTYNLGH